MPELSSKYSKPWLPLKDNLVLVPVRTLPTNRYSGPIAESCKVSSPAKRL